MDDQLNQLVSLRHGTRNNDQLVSRSWDTETRTAVGNLSATVTNLTETVTDLTYHVATLTETVSTGFDRMDRYFELQQAQYGAFRSEIEAIGR